MGERGNSIRFSFRLTGENVAKMKFACSQRCIKGLKPKSIAIELVLAS
jgi:hypothetical protein